MWNDIILNPMMNALLFLYGLLGQNFAVSIIVFTILIRLITYPLTYQQQKGIKALQALQQSKEWQEMQKKYAKDREKLAQEQMKLYQKAGVNPIGGCLPTLVQFPILIGLYQAILRELAQTPLQLLDFSSHLYSFFPRVYALIPINSQFLWMNLAQPERLFLPFLPQVGIPILAILVVISTYVMQRMMTPPSTGDQAAAMTGMMNIYMPLLLGYFSLTFASGLSIYYFTSNLLGIIQFASMGKVDWRRALGLPPAPAKAQKP
ncbi:MAG: YidC/Oxa1 family membrane protein insertase [Anaerolineales bacterium]|jgi:YidC/Oxa1 family membrane protein insertase